MAKKIVAAMSGGVDSAVAAYLLKEQGYDVVGISLRLAPDQEGGVERVGRCCSIDDMIDARRVCEKIGIPFYAIDAQAKFKESVFDPFVKAYQQGITPIPCLACNHTVKFGDLFETAERLGASLATGHYARVVSYQNHLTLARPFDLDRDQSYYLYGTNPAVLAKLYFPLGELLKPEVRKIAERIGLAVHDKKDSHEICFVPDGDHAKVVEKASGKKFSGQIVDQDGQYLGEHQGIHRFTIGQRRGLGVAGGTRLFVADIDAVNQQVSLAPKASLAVKNIAVSDVRCLIPQELWPPRVDVKIRARSEAASASVTSAHGASLTLSFPNDLFGVALGQAAVVYDGNTMLGGGILSARLDGPFARSII